ncbi:hypothetical protein M409DRAFT_17248 [Zasmidium cellare ATCC 36951]|uniref:Uncharacterized protein n=1 Tax=Zasmidium cellare ATCC 36951 TaxID=1080233 RepID=A0A6A6D6L7_ZASCE|nr:uncharacterized protein M409DRAFT_17248 [Zasmidium cellare ATCC 36951]KAF2173306.1 hypothetical protein M409DRAFT_17248 [Zasmidium cellare ATCC 36951]
MITSVVASLAVFGASAAASSLSVGKAHVVNKCTYDVYLCNVPASGGGYEQEDKTLSAGGTWDQEWTSLSNSNGWSIKLSKSEALENILQYEYTFHNDGIIWYDLSCVNGNPWDKNWEITSSTSSCNPKQQAYRYATDDAYGMQSCSQDASITVTLCSGEAADNSTSGSDGSDSDDSGSSSAAYPDGYTSVATSYSTPASTPSSIVVPTPTAYINWNNDDASSSLAAQTTPTTFATSTTAVVTEGPDGVTVTQVETAVVTNIVTAYAGRIKPRHEHHAHGHHAHAA